MTFDPLFKVLLVIFRLGTGRHSIRFEKMILDCKFQILGIKTTVGHYIITFSRNSSCLLPGFAIIWAKPGNKTTAPSWPDPHVNPKYNTQVLCFVVFCGGWVAINSVHSLHAMSKIRKNIHKSDEEVTVEFYGYLKSLRVLYCKQNYIY